MAFRFFLHTGRLLRLYLSNQCINYNGIRIVLIGGEIRPFSFLNTIFLQKNAIHSQDIGKILAHETAHIKQFHSVDSLILELISIAMWFNPFVWPYKKSLKETHEYLADHAVIAQGCSRAGYQLLILEQHMGGKLMEFVSSLKQSQIKRRITMMTKIPSGFRAKVKVLLVFPAAACLILAFAEPRPAETAEFFPGSDLQAEDSAGGNPPALQEQTKKEKEIQKIEEKLKSGEGKLKKKSRLIEGEIDKLKGKLEKTSDPETKKKLKVMIFKLEIEHQLNTKAMKQQEKNQIMLKKAQEELKSNPDPGSQAELEKMIAVLQNNIQVHEIESGGDKQGIALDPNGHGDANAEKIEILEAKLKNTQDQAEQKQLKKKIAELQQQQDGSQADQNAELRKMKEKLVILSAQLEKENDPEVRKKLKVEIAKLEKKFTSRSKQNRF